MNKDNKNTELDNIDKKLHISDVSTSLYGLFSPEDELIFVHKSREGAKKHQYEFEKAHGLGFYIDVVIVLE